MIFLFNLLIIMVIDESEDDNMEQEGGNASTSTSKRDLAVQVDYTPSFFHL